ncbi:MAG: hypothetical protein JWN04_4687, partial [Myxococcaceae bacterium]|nr:hypothetical protein [Myxococcaceae bacterium]
SARAFDLPVYQGPVNDYAAMFSPAARDQLELELRGYQAATGHQFAVLTVPTLDGLTIEDYSHRAAVGFRLGSEKEDDGLLLVVAKRERKVRIEVGYGLEGSIPDAVAARVIRQTLRPALARGDFEAGAMVAFRSLMRAAGNGDSGSAATVSPPVALASSLHMRDDAELLSVASRQHVAEQLARLSRSTRHKLAFVSVRCPDEGAIGACAEQARKDSPHLHAKGVDETLVIFFRRVEGQLQVSYLMQGKVRRAIAKQIMDDILEPRIRQGDADGAVEAAFRELVVLSGGQWHERPEPFARPVPSPPPQPATLSSASAASEDVSGFVPWFWLALGGGFVGFWVLMHRKIYAEPGGSGSGGSSWFGGSSSSDSSSWSSGDSGGSSSSDSGGGGDFGGGGASGDW